MGRLLMVAKPRHLPRRKVFRRDWATTRWLLSVAGNVAKSAQGARVHEPLPACPSIMRHTEGD